MRTRRRVALEIPTRTFLKLAAWLVLAVVVVKLGADLLLFALAIVLAIALNPAVTFLERRGLSRPTSVLVMAGLAIALLVGFTAVVLPPLAAQGAELVRDFPAFRTRVAARLPADSPVLHRLVVEAFAIPQRPEVQHQILRPLEWGQAALSGVTETVLTIATTFYLLADGKRAWAWVVAYVPRRKRRRVAVTAREVADIVYAYVRGQAITSVLFAVFVFVVLSAFHVPAVLPLAALAAVCDVVPVIGIIIATIPAALLTLTVSPTSCLAVIVLYIGYHALESYVIVPRVYGTHLRLSTLSVLLALVVGAAVGGVLGAVLILPLVAAYPTIERLWFKDRLGPDVIEDHRSLHEADTKPRKEADRVADNVIHPDLPLGVRDSKA